MCAEIVSAWYNKKLFELSYLFIFFVQVKIVSLVVAVRRNVPQSSVRVSWPSGSVIQISVSHVVLVKILALYFIAYQRDTVRF